MQPKYLILFAFTAVIFQACDPGFYVMVSNKSATEKNIQVIYPKSTSHKPTDSLNAYSNTAKHRYTTAFKVPMFSNDTVACTYVFNLPAGTDAQIGGTGLGVIGPYLDQTIIINKKDTVAITRNNEQLTKKHTLLLTGQEWTYTIK